MRVEMLNVGWMTASAALWRQGEEPRDRLRIPVPCYLIETDEERILVDTGLHPEAVADPGAFYESPETMSLFELELERDVTEQIDVSTLTRVVLTHLHFDHAGALSDAAGVGPDLRAAPRMGGRRRPRRRSSATSSIPATTRSTVVRWCSSTATTTSSATARWSCCSRPATPRATSRCGWASGS